MVSGLAGQILIFALIVVAAPTVVGMLVAGEKSGPVFRWVSGQFCLWAGFQLICVPMILAERKFSDVVVLFSGYMAAMVLLAAAVSLRRRAKGDVRVRTAAQVDGKKDLAAVFLWICVTALLLLQLVLAVLLAYEEGDDAFYVAVSVTTEAADTMYLKLPYTGFTTELDARHALAPFPVWVAYLSRLTGIRTVVMAHVALPLALVTMSYAVYFLLGKRLFPDSRRKQSLFLLLVEVLILFGGYSLYSAENFLLVRTAQGKAVFANIVVPFLFFLFLVILEELQPDRKTDLKHWLLVALVMITGCLCSTQGTLLMCILLGVVGLCTVVCYRRWKLLLPMAACGVIPVGVAALHLLMK